MKYTIALLAAIVAIDASPVPAPVPQGVTEAIAPEATAPAGCTGSLPRSFGIVNINVTDATPTSAGSGAQVTQLGDGQPGAGTVVSGAVTQISDAQPQAPTGMVVAPVSMIGDGQVQGGTHVQMMMPVTQIGDGQIQGPTVVMVPASQISDGQPQFATTTAISQIGDGQPQAPGATGISQIGDGQPQAPKATGITQIGDGQPQAPTATGVTQIGDGQPQAPTATGAGQAGDGQPQASAAAGSSSGSSNIAFCQTDSTLALTLNDGILKDSKGRIGYIASNYQFQFDGPPQAGALYTAGFSVCGNGTLTLGGSSIFYQCRSGDFYNIYDRNWAPQCNPIYIQTGTLVSCS